MPKSRRAASPQTTAPSPSGSPPLPAIIRPQLASVQAAPPVGDRWLHEIKFDGYRTMACVKQETVRLITRNGLDWTRHYGHLASSFQGLRCRQAIVDGEVAVQDAAGVTSVPALEQVLESRRTKQLIFNAFDLLHIGGNDLRPQPLLQRKAALATLLGAPEPKSRLQISEYIIGDGPAMFDQVCRMGLEPVATVPNEIRREKPIWVEPTLMARVRHSGRGSMASCGIRFTGVVPA